LGMAAAAGAAKAAAERVWGWEAAVRVALGMVAWEVEAKAVAERSCMWGSQVHSVVNNIPEVNMQAVCMQAADDGSTHACQSPGATQQPHLTATPQPIVSERTV